MTRARSDSGRAHAMGPLAAVQEHLVASRDSTEGSSRQLLVDGAVRPQRDAANWFVRETELVRRRQQFSNFTCSGFSLLQRVLYFLLTSLTFCCKGAKSAPGLWLWRDRLPPAELAWLDEILASSSFWRRPRMPRL